DFEVECRLDENGAVQGHPCKKWNQNWNQFGPFWLWFHFLIVTMKRLTDPVLKMHLRSPPSGHLTLPDGAIPGLSVRVGTKGTAAGRCSSGWQARAGPKRAGSSSWAASTE